MFLPPYPPELTARQYAPPNKNIYKYYIATDISVTKYDKRPPEKPAFDNIIQRAKKRVFAHERA